MASTVRRFRTILTARVLLEYRDHLLFLAQTPKNGGGFTLPGGKIEGEEFAKEAIVRETFEETGLLLEKKGLHLVHVTHRKLQSTVEIIFFFKTSHFSGLLAVKEPEKFSKAVWLPIDEPPKGLSPVIKYALEKMDRGKFFSQFPKKKIEITPASVIDVGLQALEKRNKAKKNTKKGDKKKVKKHKKS